MASYMQADDFEQLLDEKEREIQRPTLLGRVFNNSCSQNIVSFFVPRRAKNMRNYSKLKNNEKH